MQLTEDWCRKNLQAKGYESKEDNVAVEFVFAKCSNGSDAMIAFNKTYKSLKDFPRVFVSNFYVEHVKTVDDLKKLVCALGFGNDTPWKEEAILQTECEFCNNPATRTEFFDGEIHVCDKCSCLD